MGEVQSDSDEPGRHRHHSAGDLVQRGGAVAGEAGPPVALGAADVRRPGGGELPRRHRRGASRARRHDHPVGRRQLLRHVPVGDRAAEDAAGEEEHELLGLPDADRHRRAQLSLPLPHHRRAEPVASVHLQLAGPLLSRDDAADALLHAASPQSRHRPLSQLRQHHGRLRQSQAA